MSNEESSSLKLSAARKALLEKLLEEEKLNRSARVSIPRRNSQSPARLSFAQERLWFLYLLEGGSATYNVSLPFRLQGAVDIAALQRALDCLVQRHEILRTHFSMLNGEPRQIVESQLKLVIAYEDLRALSPVEREPRALQRAQEECRRPFDLTRAPLLRSYLWQLDDQDFLFLLSLHHNIFDEWSQEVLYRELAELYEAERGGREAALPELPIQYADFAEWQAAWMESEVAQEQLHYWKEKLAGAPQILELPTDYLRPAVQSYRGQTCFARLPGDLLDGLRRLARQEHTTLFSLLLTAFEVLLYRLSGQTDFLVGTPIANRRRPELENLIGFFLNTLALRAHLSGSSSFRQILRRVSASLLEAFDHQDIPFERLVEELRPQRDLSRHPLFQVAFVLHPASLQSLKLADLHVTPLRLNYGFSKFDLTLFLSETTEGLDAVLEYASDLFEAGTMEAWLRSYAALLRGILDDPDIAVRRLPILDEEQRRKILSWSVTETSYPREKTVAELFKEAAERYRGQPAVRYGERRLSYGELDEQTNRLGRWLRRQGVEREKLVGLGMERGLEMVLGMLGVIKAGGAYVPLDASYPAERLSYMVADSRVELVLSSGGLLRGLTGVQVVQLEEVWEEIERESAEKLEGVNEAGDLGYVMYTSGSTGKPKGVSIPQRGIVRLVKGADYLQVKAGERVGQASNMSFDAATFEVWGALLNGGELVGLEREATLTPRGLGRVLKELEVEHLFVTTALFNQIAAVEAGAFDGLKTVLFGGEAATPGWVRAVVRARGAERLLHVYGPTESTTFATWYEVKEVGERERTVAIGRGIANTSVYVLDEEMEPTVEGAVGELYLGGDGLARGYWGQAGMTAEKFVPHPYGEGERLYRTGDMVRRRWDGELEFIGRKDEQVKVRGYRIELGEIEAVLGEHEGVEAAVVALVEEEGEKRLVGYVVRRGGVEVRGAELRQWLKGRLPEYMIPGQWVFVERLPLTPNGKVDRKALPPPPRQRAEASDGFVAPRDELESRLCRLWEDLLNVQPVGVDDNFFELGGHSLLAVRLFSRLEQDFGQRLPLATLFQSPTVAELAAVLRQERAAADWSALVPIHAHGERPTFFCVHNFGGDVLDLVPLAQALGEDQPFYALQARGLDGIQPPHTTIAEMASYYLSAVQTHQSHGPYYLGGYCFGGVVAYEMARQLHAQGEQVALLAVIDGGAPGYLRDVQPLSLRWILNFTLNLRYWLRDFFQLPLTDIRVVILRRLKRISKGMQKQLGKPAHLTPREIIGDHIQETPLHRQKLMEVHMQAILDYHTPPYEGHVTLFRIQRMPLFSRQAHDMGWGRVARGGVSLQYVSGAHHNLLAQPYVSELARKLRLCINRAANAR